jgi:Tfp pilus assembly protein PilN
MRPINLLPPELARRKRARRRTMGIVALVVLYLVLLALITYWQDGKAKNAEADLAAQIQENQTTQAQIDALSGAKQLRSDYEDGVVRVESALAADVAWGRLFNDLARVIPDRIWLTSFEGSVGSQNEGEVGQVQVAATAFDYPDASTWLRVVDSDIWPAMAGGWVTSAQVAAIGEIPVVNFQSSAFLTGASISSRAEDRIPEVPD